MYFTTILKIERKKMPPGKCRKLWEPATEFHGINSWAAPTCLMALSAKRMCPSQEELDKSWGVSRGGWV